MAKKQKGKGKEEPVSAPLPSVPEAVDPPEDSLHTHTHIVDIHSVEQDAPINVMPMDLGGLSHPDEVEYGMQERPDFQWGANTNQYPPAPAAQSQTMHPAAAAAAAAAMMKGNLKRTPATTTKKGAQPVAASTWGQPQPGGGQGQGWSGQSSDHGAWGAGRDSGGDDMWPDRGEGGGGWGDDDEGAWGPPGEVGWDDMPPAVAHAHHPHAHAAPRPPAAAAAAPKTGWQGWSEEAKRYSKVTTTTTLPKGAAGGGAGTRNVLSPQQQSQILQSLLNQPNQNNYVTQAQQQQQQQYGHHASQIPSKHAQHPQDYGAFYAQPATHQKQQVNQYPPIHQQQPQQQPSKKSKKKKKEQAAQDFDPWGGGGGYDAWGAGAEGGGSWGVGGGADDGWGGGGGDGWGGDDGWGKEDGWAIPEEDEFDEDPRRVRFGKSKKHSSKQKHSSGGWPEEKEPQNLWAEKRRETTYVMPSKTLAHAYRGETTPLDFGQPHNKLNEYTNVKFIDSKREALVPVEKALFGRERMAKDRIHWMFSPDKDERVVSLLTWIEAVSYNLGAYGLHMFLQSRERGALFANADYRPSKNPQEPAFDWLTFDELQFSRDKILQESVAFYDPAVQVIVFVFLPSKTGNSVAMWRRKINVPNNTRLMLQKEINLALAGLRRDKDYLVHVDELPGDKRLSLDNGMHTDKRLERGRPKRTRTTSLPAPYTNADWTPHGPKKPKKRKWWQFFRVEW